MKIIVFDMEGKFAHFRKYYTNSSSLTYSAPPRTTVEGLIAAVLGYDIDSYYEDLNRDNLKIGIRILSENRRIMQTLNYLKITTKAEIINPKDHTQIPFEILTSNDNIKFRIYVSLKNDEVFNVLEERLKNKKYVYCPYMGAAPFSCKLNYINSVVAKQINKVDDFIETNSILNSEYICENGIKLDENINLVKERMPVDFFKDRHVSCVASYIFSPNGKKIKVKLNVGFYEISYQFNNENIIENIVFM